jgi:transcription elongation factor Elf1
MNDTRSFWETEVTCPSCGAYTRSTGIIFVNAYTFYFHLKCSGCGKRMYGKKGTKTAWVVDWSGWENLKRSESRKKYTRARRRQ